jgi:hypothetical protein
MLHVEDAISVLVFHDELTKCSQLLSRLLVLWTFIIELLRTNDLPVPQI